MSRLIKKAVKKAVETVKPEEMKAAGECTQMEIVQNMTEEEARIIAKFPPGTMQLVMDALGIPEK